MPRSVQRSRPAARSLIAALLVCFAAAAAKADGYGAPPGQLDRWLSRLVASYPDTISRIEGGDIVLKDGSRLTISDGKVGKSFDQLLDEPDIDDMAAFAYPAGAPASPPARNFDPGRIRVEPLFRALYGDCQKRAVAAKLRKVPWLPKHGGGSVSFTTAQGADRALEAVSAELDKLPASMTTYLVPHAGSYACRPIAGTDRMSMHAYGTAIDLNTKHTTYWQWAKPAADGTYRWSNRIPAEIVAIFENHGFVWGGRWYHFDTMHFEYRPEMFPGK